MSLIHINCPKCQEPIQITAPRRKLIWLLLAAVLAGVVIGIVGVISIAPRHAQKEAAWVPAGKVTDLKDLLPGTSEQDLAQGTLHSTSGATKSIVVFHNKTPGPLQLLWINYNGQRQSYGFIPAGASHTQLTFATHPWLLIDENSNAVAFFQSLPGNCVATINSPAAHWEGLGQKGVGTYLMNFFCS